MKPDPTIFIADDDEEDIMLLKTSLGEQYKNCTLLTFHNGLVLLNYLHTLTILPDVIVLDINMPVKNGFLTLHELKESASLRPIPVVMLTSSFRHEDVLRCNEMGCAAFYKKPDSLDSYAELAGKILMLA